MRAVDARDVRDGRRRVTSSLRTIPTTAPWGATARETWRFVAARPYIAGLFVWTGFDYRGEPTPHAWPCVSSQFGMLDLCGFEKDAFFLHKAYFARDGEPFVHLLPHWNSPGREGQPIRVRTYTNCDAAELFLNGESLGRKPVDPIEMAEWQVPYRPGVLRAVGFRGDAPVAEMQVETTGPAIAVGLEVHPSFFHSGVPADGHFALPVTVFALDAQNRRVPTAALWTRFSLDGPARIIGVGNGDPTSHEPNHAMSVTLFRGLAQVIVQTTTTPGAIALVANVAGPGVGVSHPGVDRRRARSTVSSAGGAEGFPDRLANEPDHRQPAGRSCGGAGAGCE